MRHLVLHGPRDLRWVEAEDPVLAGPGEALVRPLAVATCDLDAPMIHGDAPFPAPIALGHEMVAEVLEAGDEVTAAAVGDRVVVPFQVSCGTCRACRSGLTGSCVTAAANGLPAMYGFGAFGGSWGGFLADVVRVPYADAMLVRVPDGVAPEAVASASDNLPDAYRAVAPGLARSPGAEVLVVGGSARSIGLYAVDVAQALGAGAVHYVDTDPGRLAVASELGAEVVEGEPPHSAGSFPVTVEASGTHAGLACACRSCAPGGTSTVVAFAFEPQTPVPLLEMYTRGLTLEVSRAMARPQIPDVLALVAEGRLRPERVTDRVVAWDDAPDALLEPHTKLVIRR